MEAEFDGQVEGLAGLEARGRLAPARAFARSRRRVREELIQHPLRRVHRPLLR